MINRIIYNIKGIFKTKLIALLTTLVILLALTSCTPRITEEKAIEIASAYIPADVLAQTKPWCTTFPLTTGEPQSWVVIFDLNQLQLTNEEVEEFVKFGYSAVAFNPDKSYLAIIISIDAKSGNINYKDAANGPYLGGPATDMLPLNHVVGIG